MPSLQVNANIQSVDILYLLFTQCKDSCIYTSGGRLTLPMPSIRVLVLLVDKCFVNRKLFCGIAIKECFSPQLLEEFMLNFKVHVWEVQRSSLYSCLLWSKQVSCCVGRSFPLSECCLHLWWREWALSPLMVWRAEGICMGQVCVCRVDAQNFPLLPPFNLFCTLYILSKRTFQI